MPASRIRTLLLALLVTSLQLAARGEGTPESKPDQSQLSPWRVVGFPDSDLYPHYTADPLRAQSAVIVASVLDSEIPDSGDARFILRLGGNFGLLRLHPENKPNRGLQLDFKGGFFGHFDIGNSLDNIGWDGIYGLTLSWRPVETFSFRLGTLHDSAHVGDEYAERTGRARIGYTREEWVGGVSWMPSKRFLAYAEAARGYGLDEFQDPLRLQIGAELVGLRRFWNDRARWYAAIDLGAYEERDWDTRLTCQAGIMIAIGRGNQRYRLAVEYVDGRSALGEFTQHQESVAGIGLYFDF